MLISGLISIQRITQWILFINTYPLDSDLSGGYDSAIHRISHYPLDNPMDFVDTYPLDSDLSDG